MTATQGNQTPKRLALISGDAIVRGYPSTGGILIKEVDSVEVKYLGLDEALGADRSTDSTEEDAFCSLMLNLGAEW